MSFLEKIGFIESPEQERERLAQAPEGSTSHSLSKLPVNITGWVQDMLIELPWAERTENGEPHLGKEYRVVVMPFEFHSDSRPNDAEEQTPRHRNSGWWGCAVVASNHPSYPTGGYRLSISTAELVRGKQVNLLEMLSERDSAASEA